MFVAESAKEHDLAGGRAGAGGGAGGAGGHAGNADNAPTERPTFVSGMADEVRQLMGFLTAL
jgi:hypothetical protein